MSTTFRQGANLLYQTLSVVSRERGRYGREGKGDVEVKAIKGRKEVQGEQVEEMTALDDRCERIFWAPDLILDGEQITPEPDDTWRVVKNGRVEHYIVVPPTETDRCWESSDHEELLLRVFMARRTTEIMPA